MMKQKPVPVFHCRKMIYGDEFPQLSPDDLEMKTQIAFKPEGAEKTISFDNNAVIAQKMLCSKAKCWEYEKEWRIIYQNFGSKSFLGKLVKVIFGCRADNTTIKEVKSLVRRKYKKVEFSQMMMAENAFVLNEVKV